MNLYQEYIYRNSLQHGERRRNHKYLYIDSNGRYVYPEDVAKKVGKKARDLNTQGQANAVNMRKARAESAKAGNEKLANSKVAKLAKSAFYDSKAGKLVKSIGDVAKNIDTSKLKIPKSQKVKPKTQEELDREKAQLDQEMNGYFEDFARQQVREYATNEAKQQAVAKQFKYDDIGAILADPNNKSKKRKKKKKSAAVKTSAKK